MTQGDWRSRLGIQRLEHPSHRNAYAHVPSHSNAVQNLQQATHRWGLLNNKVTLRGGYILTVLLWGGFNIMANNA